MANRACLLLAAGHLEFDFLRGNADFGSGVGPPQSRHGTEMTAGAHHEASLELAIHNPLVAVPLQCRQGHALVNARAAALQQKIVKLEAANPIADGPAIIGFHLSAAHAACAKSVNRLQHAAAGVLGKINLQFLHDRRSDPSAAHLVSGKDPLVENHRGQARLSQLPCAGAAGGPAPDDQDIARIHFVSCFTSCSSL